MRNRCAWTIRGKLWTHAEHRVACAPEDAKGDKLDSQGRHGPVLCKKAGRDRLATVAEIVQQDVFVKTAMFQLERAAIAGRKTQLSAVAEALRKFSQRESQFLIAEGPPGMGKSMFLETVQRSLAQTKSILQIKAQASRKSCPALLSDGRDPLRAFESKEEKGAEILKGLSPEETSALSFILPSSQTRSADKSKRTRSARKDLLHSAPGDDQDHGWSPVHLGSG